ncbi:MAG TPA: hypothetical protein VH257_12910 [Chloroflexota bacterium]|nr:hypothetical protein [Chloroflexota bacterium]
MLTHPDDLVALARSRHEEALSWAAHRRLVRQARQARQAGTAPGAAQTPGLLAGTPGAGLVAALSGLRRKVERLGPLVRRAALVPLLVAAATVLSGLLTAA